MFAQAEGGAAIDGTPAASPRSHTISSYQSTSDPLIHRVFKNTYRVTGILTSGGMGTIYRGEHLRLQLPVAIKVLRQDLEDADQLVEHLRREALLQAMVTHPGAIKIIDLDETNDGVVFIVMEFCPGRPLSRVIDAEAPLELTRATSIAQQVLEILTAAHDVQIVHSDLTPGNIMLETLEDGSERARILDFGVAKLLEDSEGIRADLRRSNEAWGSPFYVAPEQALCRPRDHRADLYSVGVLVYEMLTGRLPLDDDDLDSFYEKLVNVPPVPITRRRADLPDHVRNVVMQALSKLPADRPGSAREFSDRLTARGSGRSPNAALLYGMLALIVFFFGYMAGKPSDMHMPFSTVENARAYAARSHPLWGDAERLLLEAQASADEGDNIGALEILREAELTYRQCVPYYRELEDAVDSELAANRDAMPQSFLRRIGTLVDEATLARDRGKYASVYQLLEGALTLIQIEKQVRRATMEAKSLAQPDHPDARFGEVALSTADRLALHQPFDEQLASEAAILYRRATAAFDAAR